MKFIVEPYNNDYEYFWKRTLIYIPEEHSFYMDNVTDKIDIELMINKISLSISNNTVVDISGFCGLNKSMISNILVPKFKKGILKIQSNLVYGFAYDIHLQDYEYPIHINIKSGWVCIGNPLHKGDAIEFIKNCVLVIDYEKKFISIWLKPKKLPFI